MRSNFHPVLKVVDGVVQAGGPIEWEEGESKGIITVILCQPGFVAGAASSVESLDVSEDEWKLPVASALSGKKFKKGWARASAEICSIGEGGEDGYPFQWVQGVTLEE
jgi:hypothetical protein